MIRKLAAVLVLLTSLLLAACFERRVLSLGAHTPGQAGASGAVDDGAAGDAADDDDDDNEEEEEHDDDAEPDRP